MELVKDKNYTGACSLVFSSKHSDYSRFEKGLYHPNQYYTESRKSLATVSNTTISSNNVEENEGQSCENEGNSIAKNLDDETLDDLMNESLDEDSTRNETLAENSMIVDSQQDNIEDQVIAD